MIDVFQLPSFIRQCCPCFRHARLSSFLTSQCISRVLASFSRPDSPHHSPTLPVPAHPLPLRRRRSTCFAFLLLPKYTHYVASRLSTISIAAFSLVIRLCMLPRRNQINRNRQFPAKGLFDCPVDGGESGTPKIQARRGIRHSTPFIMQAKHLPRSCTKVLIVVSERT